jgi:hypothetical protein
MTGDVYRAPGLTADWLNGWMAAVGVCVLLPDVTMSWSDDPVPIAVFHGTTTDLPERIVASISSLDTSNDSSYARRCVQSSHELNLDPSKDVFAERASLDRSRRLSFLAALHTDLGRDRDGVKAVVRGPLYAGAPKGRTMHDRAAALTSAFEGEPNRDAVVKATLAGLGRRVNMMGLGLDYRRLTPWSETKTPPYVDPVIELLALGAFPLFPLRGDGRVARQRGWSAALFRPTFVWPAWRLPLDIWAIDALLDQIHGIGNSRRDALGCLAIFESVRFRKRNSSDTDDGYGARRVW